MHRLGFSRTLTKLAFVMTVCIGMTGLGWSNTPQTHDVPMFHNDDGLGLLQDCTFMKARADGTLNDVPTTVAGRSAGAS